MPDGRPNFEGVWSYGTSTPLERPPRFMNRPFFANDEEAEQFRMETETARRAVVASRLGVPELVDGDRPFVTILGRKPTSLIVEPPDGRIPYLDPDRQRQPLVDRLDQPGDIPLSERCLKAPGGPPILPNDGAPYLQIVQAYDHAALLQEGHDVRIIPFDRRARSGTGIRTWHGDPRGRWDGDALVVDSTGFRDQQRQRNPFTRFDRNLRVTERLSMAGADTLWYEFTVDDPTVFARPWRGRLSMSRTDGLMFEFACHEGNYAMPGMLRGARSQEPPAK